MADIIEEGRELMERIEQREALQSAMRAKFVTINVPVGRHSDGIQRVKSISVPRSTLPASNNNLDQCAQRAVERGSNKNAARSTHKGETPKEAMTKLYGKPGMAKPPSRDELYDLADIVTEAIRFQKSRIDGLEGKS